MIALLSLIAFGEISYGEQSLSGHFKCFESTTPSVPGGKPNQIGPILLSGDQNGIVFATVDGIYGAKVDRSKANVEEIVEPQPQNGYGPMGPRYRKKFSTGISTGKRSYIGSTIFDGQGVMTPNEEVFAMAEIMSLSKDGKSLNSWVRGSEMLNDKTRALLDSKLSTHLRQWQLFVTSEIQKFPPKSQKRAGIARNFLGQLKNCTFRGQTKETTEVVRSVEAAISKEAEANFEENSTPSTK